MCVCVRACVRACVCVHMRCLPGHTVHNPFFTNLRAASLSHRAAGHVACRTNGVPPVWCACGKGGGRESGNSRIFLLFSLLLLFLGYEAVL